MVILLLTGTSLYGGGEGYCNRANAPVGVSRDAPATQSLRAARRAAMADQVGTEVAMAST
jgi:hypothetical protein